MHRLAALLLALIATATPAAAQQVTLSMRDGLVTLDARNATVRQILTEWAKVGRVTVVGGEKVAGPAVTLQLAALPEQQALDIVLRGVAGYMVVARPGGRPEATLARYDRVLILPTSAAPPLPPAVLGPQPTGGSVRQQLPPQVQPEQGDDGFQDDSVQTDPSDSRGVFQPGGVAVIPRTPMQPGMMPPGGIPSPYRVPVGGYPPSMVAPTGVPGRPVPPGTQTSLPNPFGVSGGTGAPGVVVPIQQQPLSPTNPGEGPPTSSGGTPSTR